MRVVEVDPPGAMLLGPRPFELASAGSSSYVGVGFPTLSPPGASPLVIERAGTGSLEGLPSLNLNLFSQAAQALFPYVGPGGKLIPRMGKCRGAAAGGASWKLDVWRALLNC